MDQKHHHRLGGYFFYLFLYLFLENIITGGEVEWRLKRAGGRKEGLCLRLSGHPSIPVGVELLPEYQNIRITKKEIRGA